MDFTLILSIFVMACFVGCYVVWSVTPALPWQEDGPGGMNIERRQPAPGGDLLPLLERTFVVQNGQKD